MTVHASDVASELRNRLGSSIGAAKLHKLLYLCQAWHATWTSGQPLFVETVEAWDNGPVVAELWRAERHGFPQASTYEPISDSGVSTISYVVSRYGHLGGRALIDLTHQPGPWKDAYGRGKNTRIEVNAMVEHFSQDDAADQAWFWNPDWQAGEREADQDIRNGRFTRYESSEDFIASL